MRLIAQCLEDLPPLAWMVRLPTGSNALELSHGRGVELFATGFFEGAWDGPFPEAAFAEATNVFGSGGVLSQAGAVFVGPSHTLEPLYMARNDRLAAVSNSFAFLLEGSGLALDPRDDSYGRVFSSIVHGLSQTPKEIDLKGGSLTILYHHNAVLRPDGSIAVSPKRQPPTFPDFESYRSYLRSTVQAAFDNARHPERKCAYRPIATLSSGYDSAASSAIAHACGCEESISLATSSVGTPDSGRLAAEALGMRHTDFERMRSAPPDSALEAEFLAPGMQGEDLVYSVFGEKLTGRMLITGFQGGKIWSTTDTPHPDIRRADISGCSLGEFRLRMNFLHLPVPFIGIQRHSDVRAISNSAEMAPYMTGSGYDRTVPRRLLEEAGVARSVFGRRKVGASILLFQGRNRLSAPTQQEVLEHWRSQGQSVPWLKAKIVWWDFGRNLYRVVRKLGKLLGIDRKGRLSTALAGLCRGLFGIESPVFGASHPHFTPLLIWALSRVQERYRVAGASPSSRRTVEIASSLMLMFLSALATGV
ncbi:MAG: hypothetical protein AB7P97_19340 [Hyphomonadaceae bacterium]